MIPKVVTYKCVVCDISKDETLFAGFPFTHKPKKPVCKICRNKKLYTYFIKYRRLSVRLDNKRRGRLLGLPSGSAGRAVSDIGNRAHRTDTYISDGRFNRRIL